MASDPSAFFRDMLGQWEKMANQFGGDALKSEDFTRTMGTASNATMAMQAAFQQGMEKAFAAANLPTRKDFDDLSARLAKMETALSRIEDSLGSAPGRDRPRPTRGRKPPTSPAK